MPNSSISTAGTVVYVPLAALHPQGHERATLAHIGRRVAGLLGLEYGGPYDPGCRYEGACYSIPSDTLSTGKAAELCIRTPRDFLGGVVPHPFVATKTITHPLVDRTAAGPRGWSPCFADEVREIVLPGFSAFDASDARRAGLALLAAGPVRVKRARGIGGKGQIVAAAPDELEAAVRSLDAAELARDGVVIERNLRDVTTYGVGRVEIGGMIATYAGTQRLTTNGRGGKAYGGSDLQVVRGEFDALLDLDLPAEARLAVVQAWQYDAAALRQFPGLMASRRNYDVAVGYDGNKRCSGVLEQSWRIGGATPAEIAAFEAFAADASLHFVRASSVEAYGPCDPPPDAVVYFHGEDPTVGLLTKYTVVNGFVVH
ncbi:MAG TPA: DUF3182 family protein [Burkholderiales bacterium]|nr:DUF3182 family protein [Burkholderiales bacterium]